MIESEARRWLRDNLSVSRETDERLEAFIAFLRAEMADQNLIAASTIDSIWTRHIVDSAQLLALLPQDASPSQGRWIDLGSGAGFPGLIVAILSDWQVTLVESRAKRVDYLQRAVEMLGLKAQIIVEGSTLERVETAPFSVISARAFAPLPRLFALAQRFSTDKTFWLLPKGRNAAKEWDEARHDWNGNFRIVPSVTDGEAGILVGHLTGAQRRNDVRQAAKRRDSR